MINIVQLGNMLKNTNFSNPQIGRVYSIMGIAPTVNTCAGGQREPKIVILANANNEKTEYRIRKLTPLECWRLMAFNDDDFYNAQNAGISNSQLYKQAGNSIVVDVLYYIYRNLYQAMPYLFTDLKVSSFFSGIGAFEKGLDKLYSEIAQA